MQEALIMALDDLYQWIALSLYLCRTTDFNSARSKAEA
jgi:hypothetical protein